MSRQRAYRFGIWAEYIAAAWLMLKGYRILQLRHRNSGGEIDILACHRGILMIVEVKARGDAAGNADSITAHKRMRLARAANACLAQPRFAALASDPRFGIRFDVIWVNPWSLPVHEKDAWRP